MLTERIVRDAKKGPKLQIIWDHRIKGLGLRITPKGVKSYILSYKGVGGKERRVTLARESNISLKDVQKKAGEMQLAIQDGYDPLEEGKVDPTAPTVQEGIDRYFNEFAPQRIKDGNNAPKTIFEYRKQAKRYLEPSLGQLQINKVKRRDVEKMIFAIERPIQRNRVLALTSRLFNLFERWELRPQKTNPCFGIDKRSEKPRDRVLSEEELTALSKSLKDWSNKRPHSVWVIRLLMLTGLRISEVVSMKWEYLNWETGELFLPSTKTGERKTDLPDAALDILRNIPRTSDYVFSINGREAITYKTVYRNFGLIVKDAGICELDKMKAEELKEATEKQKKALRVTPHDLRRSYMTHAAKEDGVSVYVLRDLLGHKTSRAAEGYIRALGEPVREARKGMGAKMAALMDVEGGKGTKDG